MKNTFTILAALFAVCIFVGTIGCDQKKSDKDAKATDGHVHGPECNHDAHDDHDGHDHAKEGVKDANALPTELPKGATNEKAGELDDYMLPSDLILEDAAAIDAAADEDVTEALKSLDEKPWNASFDDDDALPSTAMSATTAGDTAATAYAPVKVTAGQLTAFVDGMEKYVADAAEFADNKARIDRDANTIIALALVLGLHDQPNEYKSAAPAIIKAAQATAESASFASAKTNIAALKAALKSTEGGLLNWDAKVASMKQLMVQVPLLDGKIKTGMRRLSATTKDALAANATTIAVLCQASIPYVADTEAPAEEDKWVEACVAGRDAAASLATALDAADKTASQVAYDAMTKTCDKCHETFHKAGLAK